MARILCWQENGSLTEEEEEGVVGGSKCKKRKRFLFSFFEIQLSQEEEKTGWIVG